MCAYVFVFVFAFVFMLYLYSCPNLVVAKMEELISRPFVGQI